MFLIEQLLPGVLAAGLISGVLAIAGRLGRVNNWADAVALGIGYIGGHVMTAGWPTFLPAEATQWLPYFAIFFLCVGVLDILLRPPTWVRVALWVLGCVGILRLLLDAKFQYSWSLAQGCLWIACLALGMLVIGGCLDAAAQRDASVSLPLSLAIVAGGTGAALVLSGSMLLAQLAVVLAVALGAIFVAGFALPTAAKESGNTPLVVALLSSLWLSGYFFAELPAASALLLAVATVSAPLLVRFREGAKSWRELLLRTVVVIVPVALSVFLAFKASPALSY